MTDRSIAGVLPAQPTALVGRDREIALVGQELLRPDVRLLTLTGAAGTGKTRLAIAVAADVAPRLRRAVCFVDLAALADADLVLPAIGRALRVDDSGESLAETLRRHLAGKPILLVLDNFEHLTAAAPALGELVAACPDLKILTTSRVPLHLSWEHEFAVGALPVPDLGGAVEVDAVAACPAVILFVQRAQAVQPGFRLSEQNAAAVAELCVRLDGLPLAIELAAARTKLMTPQAMVARLDDRLGLLSGGPVDWPSRHRALRAAIDWSYSLLSSEERALFRRLAVFPGGCTLEAAEAVCGPDAEPGTDMLGLVASLVDHSLLRRDEQADEDARFSMLETIRGYALERLTVAEDVGKIRGRHAAYFLDKAEEIEPSLLRSGQARWLVYLQREHDNVIAALGWLEENGRHEDALRLAGALWPFWDARGYRREGAAWLARTLASTEGVVSRARARALNGAGNLARRMGDYGSARALHEQSLALSKALDDERGVARSLANLGNVCGDQGDYAGARAFYEQSLALRRELGDTWGIALQLVNLGILAHNGGEYDRACRLYEEALGLFRSIDDDAGVSWCLFQLSESLIGLGDVERASRLCSESLEIRQSLKDNWGIGNSLRVLGKIAQHRGDTRAAEELFQRSLEVFRRQEDAWNITFLLFKLAETAQARGDSARAATLLGAAAGLGEATGVAPPPAERAAADEVGVSARDALGEAAFAEMWSTGRSMPLDAAVGYALSAPSAAGPAPARRPPPTPSGAGPLTAREWEVAALVADGLTNRQIGAELVISERTVDRHVENILGKLGARSRAQIAAWVERSGALASPSR